jgi:hypothetical protein
LSIIEALLFGKGVSKVEKLDGASNKEGLKLSNFGTVRSD